MPTPLAEADGEFYVYQPLFGEFTFLSAVGVNGVEGRVWTIDSKAMRKVGINPDIVGVVELRGQGGMDVQIEGRTLIQLH